MITQEIKQRIVIAMQTEAERLGSKKKLATSLGVSASQVTRILKGELENVISDGNWFNIARKLAVPLGKRVEIKIAETPTFEYVNRQLANCQELSVSLILCDNAGIGKTFAARHYVRGHKNAVYVDCSQAKSKQRLVRQIAKEFGLDAHGRYIDVYETLVYYLKSTEQPLVVLDEAGDLEYTAFLELKALWNATEYVCGWYMMGADGLRVKMERNLNNKKVGYAEIFRRYGQKYQKVPFAEGEDAEEFHKSQVVMVAMVNGVKRIQDFYNKTGGSLSRAYLELQKGTWT